MMKQINKIAFLGLILFCFACSSRYNSEEAISQIRNNLNKNWKQYEKVFYYINNYEYFGEYPYYLYQDRHLKVIIEEENEKPRKLYDLDYADYIYNFLDRNEIDLIKVSPGTIKFILSMQTPQVERYRLHFFDSFTKREFPKYRIYNKGDMPSEEYGWIYQLSDKWYIESPFPIQFELDSLNEVWKFNRNHLTNFRHRFTGNIISSKYIEKQLRNSKKLGVIKIKLKESSVNFYDPRDSLKYFFCVIDYPFAEIIYNYDLFSFNIGDSCCFNHKIFTDEFCVYKNEGVTHDCTSPEVMNDNIEKIKPLITIPKYSELEKNIKNETNKYNRNKYKNTYRFYLGKIRKKRDLKRLKEIYKSSELIGECLKNETYGVTRKGADKYIFHRLRFYNVKHIIKQLREINIKELKIAVFNENDELLKIYDDVEKYLEKKGIDSTDF